VWIANFSTGDTQSVAFRCILGNDRSERQAREQHDPRKNPSGLMPSDDA